MLNILNYTMYIAKDEDLEEIKTLKPLIFRCLKDLGDYDELRRLAEKLLPFPKCFYVRRQEVFVTTFDDVIKMEFMIVNKASNVSLFDNNVRRTSLDSKKKLYTQIWLYVLAFFFSDKDSSIFDYYEKYKNPIEKSLENYG